MEDHPVPQQGRVDFGFRRTLTFRGDAGAGNLWFRAATADTITELEDGWYLINNAVRMRHPEQKSVVRRTDHGMQLLVPIRLQGDRFELVQEIDW